MEPFRIAVADDVLDDLSRRLRATRWPEAEPVDDWSQGAPLPYVQEVADYWADRYDWRAREEYLNGFDQFMTTIDGVDIHFVHVRSPRPDAIPLIITHGWPGSVVEFHKVSRPLADPDGHGAPAGTPAFHVVCPSLPGYGYSGKPTETGWGVKKIAETWAALMARLGYERYGAQGGDWGAVVTTSLGAVDADHCLGIHLNMPLGRPTGDPADDNEAEARARAALTHYQEWDSGYSKEQSTRPQTIGYSLTDSPSGQLAWILEKFWAWTDCDGHPEKSLSRDEMLDDIMFYWVNAAATSSARLYWESFSRNRPVPVPVPTGVAAFPKEILPAVRQWCEGLYPNIVHWTDMPRGGHFAAFEEPELFTEDVRAFFAQVAGGTSGS
ncbi:MAG: epoxide hydrolase family protein [Acidimicrobiales bacterium]